LGALEVEQEVESLQQTHHSKADLEGGQICSGRLVDLAALLGEQMVPQAPQIQTPRSESSPRVLEAVEVAHR
jgi:hypothetical protein